MKFLVTGAAGYLGTTLTSLLLAADHSVFGIDDGSAPHAQPIASMTPRFMFSRADCAADWNELSGALSLFRPDVIVPLAGIVGQKACEDNPKRAEFVNLEAIRRIVLLSKHIVPQARIVFPATNSGYGTRASGNDAIRCDEKTPLDPISVYGRTKVEAERHVLENHPNAVSLRFATLFGLSMAMRWDLLVNFFVREAVKKNRIEVFEGGFRRNMLHVLDAAAAILHTATLPVRPYWQDNAYNVGLAKAWSKWELAEMIASQIGPHVEVVKLDGQSDPDRRNYLVVTDRLTATGFTPRLSVESAIPLIAGDVV